MLHPLDGRNPGTRLEFIDYHRHVSNGLADETDYPHQAVLDSSEVRVDPATGTLRMRAALANPSGLIAPGMFVRVRLPLGKPYQALLVPERAVGSDKGNKRVFVVTAADVVEARTVKLGPLHDGMRAVKEGLTIDDAVIVSGQQHVQPGLTVKTKTAPLLEQ
jgi:RND family efflux transporter MFP subunit